MCTRSGAIDPGILLHLLRHGTDLIRWSRRSTSGPVLSGLSELPGDTQVLFPKARDNDRRAKLAMDVFIHRLRAGIGSMLASLGRLDVLVFTDGIGETEPAVRQGACDAFAFPRVAPRTISLMRPPPSTRISQRWILPFASLSSKARKIGRSRPNRSRPGTRKVSLAFAVCEQ